MSNTSSQRTFSSNDNVSIDTRTHTHTHTHTRTHTLERLLYMDHHTVIGTISSDLKEVDFMTVRLYYIGGL